MNADAQYCFDLVRQHDRDRYLASLFAPDDARGALLALSAFNLEVARIAGAVSEPNVGMIRQQWWLDTLDAIVAGGAVDHPVARELAAAIGNHALPGEAFRALILAREFDLYDDPMPDLRQLEGYLGETSSALIQLAALVLAGGDAAAVAEAAGLAGVAHGIAAILVDGERARKFLPQDLVAAEGEDGARKMLAEHARMRLAEARAASKVLPRSALPAFLPVSLVEGDLGGRRRSYLRRQTALWWAARNNRF